MTWWAIDVRTPPDQRDSVSAWLVAHTGQAVEEREDGTLVAFAPDEQGAATLVEELGRELTIETQAERHRLESTDWSIRWREGLGARRVGRLTVVPSWLPEASEPDPLTIVLDPETAFGSGEHGSTRVALTLMSRLLKHGSLVLDLGSGSGILSIAAVKLGAARAVGIELDSEANEVARRNAARNGVSEKVNFVTGDAAILTPLLGRAGLIVSNILRTINTDLLPVIGDALAPGGIAIFSGMEQAEALEFSDALAQRGFSPLQEAFDAGWWGVAAERP